MASDVDLCNLALAHLGDEATVTSIEPPEGSAQAEHCARFYPMARDMLLEMHAWGHATRTAALVLREDTVDGWAYAYTLPNHYLHALHLYAAGGRREKSAEFEIEVDATGQTILLTDAAEASLRFIQRVTDTTRYPPQFNEALSWLLASMLAGPLIKGDSGAKASIDCWKVFLIRFGTAAASDANASITRLDAEPIWITQR